MRTKAPFGRGGRSWSLAFTVLLLFASADSMIGRESPPVTEPAPDALNAAGLNVEARLAHPVVPGGEVRRSYVQVDVGPAGAKEGAEVRRTTDGLPRDSESAGRMPVNLAVVLDRSATMNGERLQRCRDLMERLLDWLHEDDVLAIVVYDSNVQVLQPASRSRDRQDLRTLLGRLEGRGHSNLFGGVTRGAAELRRFTSDDRISRILLISDGKATIGPGTPKALGELGASLRKEGISVSTIGIGLDYNEDLMVELAAQSQGNHYFVEDLQTLEAVLDEELGLLGSVAASGVVLQLGFTPGVVPVRSLGLPVDIHDGVVTANLGELHAGEAATLLFEVMVDPSVFRLGEGIVTARVGAANGGPSQGGAGAVAGRLAVPELDLEEAGALSAGQPLAGEVATRSRLRAVVDSAIIGDSTLEGPGRSSDADTLEAVAMSETLESWDPEVAASDAGELGGEALEEEAMVFSEEDALAEVAPRRTAERELGVREQVFSGAMARGDEGSPPPAPAAAPAPPAPAAPPASPPSAPVVAEQALRADALMEADVLPSQESQTVVPHAAALRQQPESVRAPQADSLDAALSASVPLALQRTEQSAETRGSGAIFANPDVHPLGGGGFGQSAAGGGSGGGHPDAGSALDPGVLALAMEQEAREAREQAIGLRDAGEVDAAIELLLTSAAGLEALAVEHGIDWLHQQAVRQRADAELFRLTGQDWDRARKQLRESNFRMAQPRWNAEVDRSPAASAPPVPAEPAPVPASISGEER